MSESRLLLVIFLALGSLGSFSDPSFGAKDSGQRDLDYLVLAWGGNHSNYWSENQVNHVCSRLGRAMSTDQGLWGLGVFRRYGCYLNGKLVAGVAGTSPWLMMLEPGANKFTIGLYRLPTDYVPDSGDFRPSMTRIEVLYEMHLTPSQWLPEFLRNEDNARLVAAPFILSLPAVARMTIEEVARGYKSLKAETFDERVVAIAPPSRVQLNSELSLNPVRRDRLADMGRGVLTTETNKQWGWRLYDTAQRFPADDLFLSAVGAVDVRAQLAETIARKYKDSSVGDDAIVRSAALNGTTYSDTYQNANNVAPLSIGVRYGRDINGSEAQFRVPIATIGLVIEARAGIAKGFRAYYDQTPTVTNPETQVEYGARRLQFGRTFSFKMPFIIDRLEFTPRIGVWDVQSKVLLHDPVYTDTEYVLPVAVKRAVGVGFEGGAEFAAADFVGRVWGSMDVSVGGKLDAYSGGSVQGTRFGADGIYRLVELGGRRTGKWLAPMIFVVREDINITSGGGHSFQRGEQTIEFDAANIAYAMTYVGGGVGLIF